MAKFIVNRNAQANGDHEVHNKTTGCSFMPATENQIDIGEHANCSSAVISAKRTWPTNRINGCYYCSNSCHTT